MRKQVFCPILTLAICEMNILQQTKARESTIPKFYQQRSLAEPGNCPIDISHQLDNLLSFINVFDCLMSFNYL